MATKEETDILWQQKEFVWVGAMLKKLQQDGFYGKLTLEIREGHIIRALKEESLKPPVPILPEKVVKVR